MGFELGIQRAFDNRQATDNEGGGAEVLSERSTSAERNNVERSISCIGYSEIDKYAIKVYERHFEHENHGDATTINTSKLPDFDLLVGGFPCQAFSVAGKRGGFDDTRGTLFFSIARVLADKKPGHLLLENVKGLLSHDGGKTFQTILGVLSDLGYETEWQVLNSKDFGVPQNRERVFIVGHLGGGCGRQVFPITGTNGEDTRIIGQDVAYTIDANYHKGTNTLEKSRRSFVSTRWQRTEKGKKARAESQKQGRDYTPFNNGYRELKPVPGKPSGAVTAQAVAKDSLLSDFTRIRRLTPRECERLQGFPDDWTRYDQEGNEISDTQRYKMVGNAVTVNVIEAIISKFECLK